MTEKELQALANEVEKYGFTSTVIGNRLLAELRYHRLLLADAAPYLDTEFRRRVHIALGLEPHDPA